MQANIHAALMACLFLAATIPRKPIGDQRSLIDLPNRFARRVEKPDVSGVDAQG